MTQPAASRTRLVESILGDWAFAPAELPSNTSWEGVADVGERITLPHTWNAIDGQAGGSYRRGRSTYARVVEAAAPDVETWIEFDGANSSADRKSTRLNSSHWE